MRKSITTRYFKTTAILLLSSIFLLGIALMFFASRYFRSDRERMLSNNIDSASQIMLCLLYTSLRSKLRIPFLKGCM